MLSYTIIRKGRFVNFNTLIPSASSLNLAFVALIHKPFIKPNCIIQNSSSSRPFIALHTGNSLHARSILPNLQIRSRWHRSRLRDSRCQFTYYYPYRCPYNPLCCHQRHPSLPSKLILQHLLFCLLDSTAHLVLELYLLFLHIAHPLLQLN
ncbi:hypothetical protein EV356DRAFT_310620 [Viridothelium virens]|uniref:Uncharacterized protein n=1 Tax=Viridothelium virens TaxID=1048519 RepID=A0A6A6GZJ2_VIRVR|nr:hypothetical protein EV356DRAFT_310620 [Viridothelium virens]